MRLRLTLILLMLSGALWAGPIVLISPDSGLKFIFRLAKGGTPEYDVVYNGVQLVAHSPLSLRFAGSGGFGRNLVARPAAVTAGADDYTLVVGKTRSVHDRYREVLIPLEERNGKAAGPPGSLSSAPRRARKVDLEVRVFNDGLAFRWVIPAQEGWDSINLVDEGSCFNLVGDPLLMATYREGFTTSHEGLYTNRRFSAVTDDTLMDMPVFLDFDGAAGVVSGKPGKGAAARAEGSPHIYAAITEARLVDYAGMYLVKHGGLLKSELSPYPGQPGGPVPSTGPIGAGGAVDHEPGTAADLESGRKTAVRVRATLPHSSPWRVMLVGSRAGALIESNVITDLNDPCAIKDVRWIKNGKTDFHWWNGDVVADTGFQPGINFESNKYYIDFCARNHIDYHTVIGWSGIAWYTNDGVSYDAGPHSDVTRPIPGLDMKQICDYAHSKGVGIRVWVHWRALYPKIDSAFAIFQRWGVSGMMVD
ncbi:MAG TPA: glycoside hydrolase family 97 N-terminal domain-containing protein, partial [Puia sp.]|nr:glycoside hydrolase family 97 N-terminal domain-containing protein [Puia sp.]